MTPFLAIISALVCIFLGCVIGIPIQRWIERRRARRLEAEEVERILLRESTFDTQMEMRLFLDRSTQSVVSMSVPVNSPVLPGQQITAADFNRLEARIAALESRRR
jgi:Na+/glutamate symporter